MTGAQLDRAGRAGVIAGVAVDALAAYRLTRLVTRDVVTGPARDLAVRYVYAFRGDQLPAEACPSEHARSDPAAPWPAKLLTCDWCVGVWVAAAVCAARALSPRAWPAVARVFAVAAVVGIAADREVGG